MTNYHPSSTITSTTPHTMELKPCSHSLVEHVTNIWVKQLHSPFPENDPTRYSLPTYPYKLVNVEQVFPGRDHLEDFEARRNELDQRLERGKVKLETIHGFYSPSSEESYRSILKDGFHKSFSGELTFSLDPVQAIREGLGGGRVNKLILSRVSLGWKEYDYTEINNKYKIKNLRGIIPSFVITYQLVQAEKPSVQPEVLEFRSPPAPVHHSPDPTPSYSSPSGSTRLPKYITDLDK